MRARRSRVLGALLFTLVGARALAADSMPAKNQAVLMMRVLLYDRNLAQRSTSDSAKVVVVSAGQGARAEGDEMAETLTQLAKRAVVGGRKIVVQHVNASELKGVLTKETVTAVYLAAGVKAPDVLTATRAAHALTFSADTDCIEAGASVGFVQRAERIAIAVNLKSAKAEGADLDSALLALAEVK